MRYRKMNTVASWISDDLLEAIEDIRWQNRISKSEFIRQALELYVELIQQSERRHHHRGRR